MGEVDKSGPLPEVARKLGIGRLARHVFLCVGESCCPAEVGAAAWDALKKELKDRDLSLTPGPNECYRTKVGCLRLCKDGPIAVVYPEGTWYSGLTADRIPLLVQQHLIDGQPVQEWVVAEAPLPRRSEAEA